MKKAITAFTCLPHVRQFYSYRQTFFENIKIVAKNQLFQKHTRAIFNLWTRI